MEINDLEILVNGHTKTLYGNDGRGGLVKDMEYKVDDTNLKSYIKKPPLALVIFLFAVIIIPVTCLGLKVWSAQESNALKYGTIDSVQEIEKRVIRLEERYGHIQSTLARIETKLDSINGK